MRRISFYANRNRSGNLLHIETDGCIVNIQVGLQDHKGREITSINILPDRYFKDKWTLDGDTNNRVTKEEKSK